MVDFSVSLISGQRKPGRKVKTLSPGGQRSTVVVKPPPKRSRFARALSAIGSLLLSPRRRLPSPAVGSLGSGRAGGNPRSSSSLPKSDTRPREGAVQRGVKKVAERHDGAMVAVAPGLGHPSGRLQQGLLGSRSGRGRSGVERASPEATPRQRRVGTVGGGGRQGGLKRSTRSPHLVSSPRSLPTIRAKSRRERPRY